MRGSLGGGVNYTLLGPSPRMSKMTSFHFKFLPAIKAGTLNTELVDFTALVLATTKGVCVFFSDSLTTST